MRFLTILVFFLPLSHASYRCGDAAGISNLKNLIDCGDQKIKIRGFKDISSSISIQARVLCASECYLNETRAPCRLKYLKLILQHKDGVKSYAKGKKCNFKENQLLQEIRTLRQQPASDDIWKGAFIWIDSDTNEKFDQLPENAIATGPCEKVTISETQCWFKKNSNMGCEPVGEYSRIELNPPKAQCDPSLKKRILCMGKIYCEKNSEVFDIMCLADMGGNCPTIKECISDREVDAYSELVKKLDSKKMPVRSIDQ